MVSRSKKQGQYVEENVDDPRAVKDSGKALGVDILRHRAGKHGQTAEARVLDALRIAGRYALLVGLRACRRPWPHDAECIDQWFCPRQLGDGL